MAGSTGLGMEGYFEGSPLGIVDGTQYSVCRGSSGAVSLSS